MPEPRDPWFDNAKMLLVTLVVVGHSWTLLSSNPFDNWTYDFLYLWHVPAFVMVTGYLSRNFTWTRARLWSLVRTVVVPYLIFEGALALFRIKVGHIAMNDLWTDPHWPMWYLSALFFWRLMTPIFRWLRLAIVIAVTISLAAGLWAGDLFDMARIFGLLPFYVIGLHMRPEHWDRLRSGPVRLYAALGMLVLGALAWFGQNAVETEWLYYRSRYDALDANDLRAEGIRMMLLILGAIGAFCILALVPRTKSWLTGLGSATLVVYLFHGFVVLGLRYGGYLDWAAAHPAIAWPLTTIWAALLAFFLAWRPISSRLTLVVDPIGSLTRWRQRRTPRESAPTSA